MKPITFEVREWHWVKITNVEDGRIQGEIYLTCHRDEPPEYMFNLGWDGRLLLTLPEKYIDFSGYFFGVKRFHDTLKAIYKKAIEIMPGADVELMELHTKEFIDDETPNTKSDASISEEGEE